MDNYLSAEQLIIDRIKSQVPELIHVLHAADLDGVTAKAQFSPVAHVLYKGDRVADGEYGRSTYGNLQLVDQLWYVVLGFRNSRTTDTGESVRLDAGAVLFKILKALQGWSPSSEHSPMKRINGVDPGFAAGFLYIPLLFSTRISV